MGRTGRRGVENQVALWELSWEAVGRVWAVSFHSLLKVISVAFLEFCYIFLITGSSTSHKLDVGKLLL